MPRQRVTLQDLSDAQFFCLRGADGHAWSRIRKPEREGRWGFRIFKRCVNCEKELELIHNTTGRDPVRIYTTPKWHLKVTEPYETSDVRVEALNRSVGRARPVAKNRTQRRSGRTKLVAV